ncbi:MAG: MFS transporter [Alphaproteobacteria bacterium]|nr:MFS transporter [Alphaproteobacteria bacterium]
MADEAVEAGWRALLRPAWLPAVAVLVGGVLLHSMNVLMLATVLPSVVEDLGGARLMSWPNTAFLASSIVAAACTGYLASVLGARAVFCTGALIFGLGALACALAPVMGQIVVGRFIQGFGGGLLNAMAYVLVRSTFPERLWARGFALLSGAWSLSIVVGPLVGGLFAGYGHWRGAFFAVTALAAVLALVAWRALPRGATSSDGARVPGLRVALICLAIATVSAMAITPGVLAKVGLFVAAVATLMLMLAVDRSAHRPLLPTDAFSLASPTGVGLWLVLLTAIAYSPLQIFVPIFLQVLHGLDPLAAGYMVAGASFGWTAASLVVAGTPPERADRLLIAGPGAMAIGLAGVALLLTIEPAVMVFAAIATVGAGIGGCWAFIAQRVMHGARPGEGDLAASSIATVQQTGFALGAALSGLAANAAGLTSSLSHAEVAAAAFWVPTSFVLSALAAAVAAARLVRLGRSAAN